MSLPTLRTDRLVLRPFAPADAPRIQTLAGDREVASSTLTIPHPYPDGVAEAWIAGHVAAWEARERLTLAITTATDGLIGGISLHLTYTDRRAELGYWIGRPCWNRGYATEAAAAMVGFGFDALGLHRIIARHFPRNPASGRVLTKIGMTWEGTLRQHAVRWGKFEDLECYGLLEPEWRRHEGSGAGPEATATGDPHQVVLRLYELLSGPADQARPWYEIRNLFFPDALLRSELTLPDGSHQSGTWTLDEFCAAAEAEYATAGFWERELAVRVERFGQIAQVWTTYESRIGALDTAPVGRGINAVQLLHRNGRWRITSLVFQIERGTPGIPPWYLGPS